MKNEAIPITRAFCVLHAPLTSPRARCCSRRFACQVRFLPTDCIACAPTLPLGRCLAASKDAVNGKVPPPFILKATDQAPDAFQSLLCAV